MQSIFLLCQRFNEAGDMLAAYFYNNEPATYRGGGHFRVVIEKTIAFSSEI